MRGAVYIKDIRLINMKIKTTIYYTLDEIKSQFSTLKRGLAPMILIFLKRHRNVTLSCRGVVHMREDSSFPVEYSGLLYHCLLIIWIVIWEIDISLVHDLRNSFKSSSIDICSFADICILLVIMIDNIVRSGLAIIQL